MKSIVIETAIDGHFSCEAVRTLQRFDRLPDGSEYEEHCQGEEGQIKIINGELKRRWDKRDGRGEEGEIKVFRISGRK